MPARTKTIGLPLTEEIDFHYLLGLLPPLYEIPEYSLLPELFSIIGHEALLTLCKYAGGETITIPTLERLSLSIDVLQDYYDITIKGTKTTADVPERRRNLYGRVAKQLDTGIA